MLSVQLGSALSVHLISTVGPFASRSAMAGVGSNAVLVEHALTGDSHAGMWITALDEIGRERGWRIGIVDALPVRHDMRRIGVTYSPDAAIEARSPGHIGTRSDTGAFGP